jgi:hypothetical protein
LSLLLQLAALGGYSKVKVRQVWHNSAKGEVGRATHPSISASSSWPADGAAYFPIATDLVASAAMTASKASQESIIIDE